MGQFDPYREFLSSKKQKKYWALFPISYSTGSPYCTYYIISVCLSVCLFIWICLYLCHSECLFFCSTQLMNFKYVIVLHKNIYVWWSVRPSLSVCFFASDFFVVLSYFVFYIYKVALKFLLFWLLNVFLCIKYVNTC